MAGPPPNVAKAVFALLAMAIYVSAFPLPSGVNHLVSRGIVSPSNSELLHNTIAFAVPAIIAFALRMINRGFVLKKLHLEDFMMCVTVFFYITLMVLINVAANYNTNLYPPEQEASILANPADVHNRVLGSKIVIALEQSMIASTWGVKLCIWVFLMRLFRNLPRFEMAMWALFWYIWLGFFVIEIVYYGVFCRPFDQYWAVPVKDLQCATYHNYSIVQMVFNISSDFCLILIPLPMVSTAHLPTKRKILLVGIFGMAGFTILAAILNKYYNFKSPMTTVYQLWYIRESSVAVCVGNLICTWQLFQKLFSLRSFNNKHANIVEEQRMPRFINSHGPIRKAWCRGWDFITPGGDTFKTYRDPKTATDGSIITGDISQDIIVGGETGTTGRNIEKDRRVTTTTYMMTLNRDGDDARPALAFRNEHDIY